MRRCLVLLGRLLRGPATRDELLDAVRWQLGADAYLPNPETRRISAFEQDLQKRLPKSLLSTVRFDRTIGKYTLIEFSGLPGFDLPDEALAALAFLEDTFQPGTPHFETVGLLLNRLSTYLPEARRRDLERQRVALRVDLRQLDHDRIAPAVERAVERARAEQRLLRFYYLSPGQEDGGLRRHTVEPYERYFDTTQRHHYLYAYCREVDGPKGSWPMRRYFRYRLGRIQVEGIEVLETKLPPYPPRTQRHALVYRLAPAIARLGDVTEHFEAMQVTPEEEGSVLVQAETDDLFLALQTLLRYGPNCQVLGGPEALREMRRMVAEMARLYENS